MSAPFTLVLIIGWGRSGSTLLDNLLGQMPSCVSLGEVRFLWRRGMTERRPCGCGLAVPDCPFWSQVIERAGYGHDDSPGLTRLYGEAERSRQLLRYLALSSRLSTGALRQRRILHAYGSSLERLWRAASDVAESSIVVDSSKHPVVGLGAVAAGIKDVRVIHLVRDPRAVAYSWSRAKPSPAHPSGVMVPQGPVSSSAYWTMWNLAAQRLLIQRLGIRHVTVRYEDFVSSPHEVAADLASFVGSELPTELFENVTQVRLSPNHSVQGNPSRFDTGLVQVRPDHEWRYSMGVLPRVAATVPALPLLYRFGYKVFGAPAR